jgi:hypothetical protein
LKLEESVTAIGRAFFPLLFFAWYYIHASPQATLGGIMNAYLPELIIITLTPFFDAGKHVNMVFPVFCQFFRDLTGGPNGIIYLVFSRTFRRQ